jgi:hypothetical protein
MKVYYFTSANHAVSNLAFKRIKLSRFNKLNDPFELLAANLVNERHRRAVIALKNQLDQTKGLICFSSSWSNPLLWGHYADRHTGIALGFEISSEYLTQMHYTNQRVKITFDEKTRRVVNGMAITDKLIRTKFEDWRYEDEYRMFVSLSECVQEGSHYFCEFSSAFNLQEVILGMNCDIPIEQIRKLLAKDLSAARIKKAGLHFSKFKVIEDRSFRPR